MVALQVRHERSGRVGSLHAGDRSRDYVQVFKVLVSSYLDDPIVAINAVGIPRIWTPYIPPSGAFDMGSWCKDIKAEPVDNANVFTVTCEYSSKLERGSRPDNQHENPMLRPPEFKFGVNRVSMPWLFDRMGHAVTNSAGEYFDPPPEEDEKRITIRISRNQASYDPGYYTSFIDTVNSDPWMNFRRGQVKCVDIGGDLQWESSYAYWRVYFSFEAKAPRLPNNRKPGNAYDKVGRNYSLAWTRWLLDRGYREKKNGVLRDIIDKGTGQKVSQPAMLDGSGLAIPLPSNDRVTPPVAVPPTVVESQETWYGEGSGGVWEGGTTSSYDVYPPGTTVDPDNGASGRTAKDPWFLGYNQFPTRKFSRLNLF